MTEASDNDSAERRNKRIREAHTGTTGDDLFYSLCRPQEKRKKKSCLRCGTKFLSWGIHNRFCGTCNHTINKPGAQGVTNRPGPLPL